MEQHVSQFRKDFDSFVLKVTTELDSANKGQQPRSQEGAVNEKVARILQDSKTSQIQLNVGGRLCTTTTHTLTSRKSILSDIARSNPKDVVFIDRNPKHFGIILEFLRTGTAASLQYLSPRDRKELTAEVEFYELDDLLVKLKEEDNEENDNGSSGLLDSYKRFRGKIQKDGNKNLSVRFREYKSDSGSEELLMIPSGHISQESLDQIRKTVSLPPNTTKLDWLSTNSDKIVTELKHFYAQLKDFCTATTCSTMSAGPKYEFLWADGVKIKKPIKLSAPEYMRYLFEWIATTKSEGLHTAINAELIYQTIFKRLFRVYAHLYRSHYEEIATIDNPTEFNASFKYFLSLVKEFSLVEEPDLISLQDVIKSLQ